MAGDGNVTCVIDLKKGAIKYLGQRAAVAAPDDEAVVAFVAGYAVLSADGRPHRAV
jgi:hypothetical protein